MAGSSSSRISGSPSSAAASASRRRVPYEHAPIRRSATAVQAGALERLVGIAAPGARGRQRELGVRGPAGMEAVTVEHPADPAVGVRAPGRRPGEAEQDPERRRLPGAVRSQKAAHAALRDREREPVERRRPAVALGQVLDGERVHPFEDAAGRYLHAVYRRRSVSPLPFFSVIETVTVNEPLGSLRRYSGFLSLAPLIVATFLLFTRTVIVLTE